MRRRIPTAVAIIVGLITLVGYFVAPHAPGFRIHLVFIRWAAILAAVAFMLGILNLFNVHLGRIVEQHRDWPYSLFLVFSAALVIIIAVLENRGPGGQTMTWILQYALIPLEGAAASLLVFFLAAAAFRAMRRRPDVYTFSFVLTIILVLLSAIPWAAGVAVPVQRVREWLVNVIGAAGTRGMLLGVALGTIAAGLRVLVGIDRPHSEREP